LLGLVSLGVLVSRRRDAAVHRELSRARAEQRWLARVARLVLAVRDLTNSPLQTLCLTTALVRSSHGGCGEVAERMDSAVERLRRLNDALAPLDGVVEWRPEDTSFSAEQRIEAEVRETIAETSRKPRAGPRPRPVVRALDPVEDARRAVLHLSCTNVVGSAVAVALFAALGFPILGFLLLGALAATGVALALRAPSLPRRSSLALFSIECISALIAGWHGSEIQAGSGRAFVPFVTAKIVALLVAIFSPSPFLGAGLIVLAALGPVVQASLWSAEVWKNMTWASRC
jgi:hypothetical protein